AIGGERLQRADQAEVGAAGEHGLLALARPLRPQDVEREPVPFEDAGALAELRDRRIPVAALPEREHELVLGARRGERGGGGEQGGRESARAMGLPSGWSRAGGGLPPPGGWGGGVGRGRAGGGGGGGGPPLAPPGGGKFSGGSKQAPPPPPPPPPPLASLAG